MKRLTFALALMLLTGCSANAQDKNTKQPNDNWQPNTSVVKSHEQHRDDDKPQCWGTVIDKKTHIARRCMKSGSEEYKDRAGHLYCYNHRNQAANR